MPGYIGEKRVTVCKWGKYAGGTSCRCGHKDRYWKHCVLDIGEKDCKNFEEMPEDYW